MKKYSNYNPYNNTYSGGGNGVNPFDVGEKRKEFDIDYVAGTLSFLSNGRDYVTVESKLMYSVEKIPFQFKQIKIEFICIKSTMSFSLVFSQ